MTKICLTNFKPISTGHVSKAANRNGPCRSLTARAGKLLKIDFVILGEVLWKEFANYAANDTK